MKVTAYAIVALALLSLTARARKSYLVKEEHQNKIPKVRATDYPYEEVYKNFDDDFTVYYQGAMSVGWEFDQTMSENQDSYPDVYHLTLDIVLKTSFYFSPVFNFPRLIYLEPIFEIQEFNFGYHIDMAKFWIYPSRNDLLCFSAMFRLDPITVLSTLIMRFQECYKTFWNCVYNLKNWTGEDALFFENCSQSSKTTITTFEKTYKE